jgi:NAD(P)H dehydrogenase (quinone)
MRKKRIFILLGHPDKVDSINSYFAGIYEEAARMAGHEVRRTNIGDLQFDPILHKGYRVRQELEPDLLKVQEDVKWCEHLVVFYPTWWSSMPALLKGLVERMWLPGFAYNYRKNGLGWIKRLKGRTARIITTSQSNPLLLSVLLGNNTDALQRGVLWFSGFFPVRLLKIGNAEKLSERWKAYWTARIARLGRRGR